MSVITRLTLQRTVAQKYIVLLMRGAAFWIFVGSLIPAHLQ